MVILTAGDVVFEDVDSGWCQLTAFCAMVKLASCLREEEEGLGRRRADRQKEVG